MKSGRSIDRYSAKFPALIKKLCRGGLSFVYSAFTNKYGIEMIVFLLEREGYKNFERDGPGKKRYAIWSGDQSQDKKRKIKKIFNSEENDDCSQIQIIIGSPAIKEGVSLFRVRYVHILEMYWNYSRLEQIYGRAVRYCSHKTLKPAERNVQIIYYHSYNPLVKRDNENYLYSIDAYMMYLAEKKKDENKQFNQLLKSVSI